ncbi:MAG: glycosyltransferase [Bacteroides thetaiotaomicron]|nr:glycosyltransferase [Bacteroides thetaiotaomicron]
MNENVTSNKISVIIPAFNAEKYLMICYACLKAQTYPNLEIIIVDDGSTDETARIAKDIESYDHRVKYVYKKNQGAGEARNTGIKIATGGYISFIDVDDRIHENYFEILMNAINVHDADIACCGCEEIFEDESVHSQKLQTVLQDRFIDSASEYFDDICLGKEKYMAVVWGKIIRADFARKVSFANYTFYEDLLYMTEIFSNNPRTILLSYKGYYHIYQSNSLTNSIDLGKKVIKAMDSIEVSSIVYQMCNRFSSEKYRKVVSRNYNNNVYNSIMLIGKYGSLKDIKYYKIKYRNYVKDAITIYNESIKNTFLMKIFLLNNLTFKGICICIRALKNSGN